MAFKLDAFKPKFGRRETATDTAQRAPRGGLPLVGRLPVTRQLQVLTGFLVVLLLLDAAILWWLTWSGHMTVGRLLVLALFAGAVSSVEIPARQSLMIDLPRTGNVLLCIDAIYTQDNIDHDAWGSQADPEAAKESAHRLKEIAEREDGLATVRADVWVETESQKGILIGRGGAKVREIGTAARRSLEAELAAKVHLDLQVRVRRWRRDEGLLDRLGIE